MAADRAGGSGMTAAHREHLRHRVHRYLNLPVALAAILFVLVAFTHISGSGTVPWRRHFWHGPSVILLWLIWAFFIVEFAVKFALAPHKPTYLRRHWDDAIVALLPVCGVLRLIEVVIISPLINLLRGEEAHPHLAILFKRKLGKLALISTLVILIVAVLAYIFENGARGSPIQTFGQALWWAAATATTVGNQLYPVTVPGEILSFFLMLFAIGVFSYLTSSLASALIGGDAAQSAGAAQSEDTDDSGGDASSADASSQTDNGARSASSASQANGDGATPSRLAVASNGRDGSGRGEQRLAQLASQSAGARPTPRTITLSPEEIATLRALLDRLEQHSS